VTAAALLHRALEEPPPEGRRGPLLGALGRVEALLMRASARVHLRAALDAAADRPQRAALALELARAHLAADDGPAAAAVLLDLERELGGAAATGHDRDVVLEAAMLRVAWGLADDHARLRPLAEPAGTQPERRLLGALAYQGFRSTTAADAAAMARAAVAAGLVRDATSPVDGLVVAHALEFADALEESQQISRGLVEGARRSGDPGAAAIALPAVAIAAYRSGALATAVEEGRIGLELCAAHDLAWPRPTLLGAVVAALAAQGRGEELEAVLAEADVREEELDSSRGSWLLWARGTAHLGARRHEAALADFVRSGEVMARWGHDHPAFHPWRSSAATALLALGRRAEARALAEEELGPARRWGAARPLGVALRAVGLARGGEEGLAVLQEAAAVVAGSPARLERALTLLELGAALRRAGNRAAARQPLREALDLAARCGAHPLVERARTELAAAGGRPRTPLLTGVDSLTPSERRVAELAAAGRTNREIAQELFVSPKTVENTLGAVYRKLAVPSRQQLAAALE
jgi:DNA-binding CsgD family transcriptional regulator